MKAKLILFAVVVLAASAGFFWVFMRQQSASVLAGSSAPRPLYYTCSMHPWVHESKPGQCPICGMNLTPVYANTAGTTNHETISGDVSLEPDSISTINVQTEPVERRPLRHTLHLSGEIIGNSSQAAWFQFIAYQRDLAWLKIGQALNISVAGVPGKTFTAKIKLHGVKPFAESDFDMMSSSTTMRAEISDPPVEISNFGDSKLFNGLHAEAHLVAETDPVLAIPRSAIISRGLGATVYVDKGDGHYVSRPVTLGRIGDHFAEVVSGLNEGEKVVTTGNVLIDSEAQLTRSE
ncbi:MAG TPA: heavy metal-binding domain-containing protein [Pseudomonadales bacterium]|nr:heavy metal-binding domain-containing protein [Pseudomonadales bacterium]